MLSHAAEQITASVWYYKEDKKVRLDLNSWNTLDLGLCCIKGRHHRVRGRKLLIHLCYLQLGATTGKASSAATGKSPAAPLRRQLLDCAAPRTDRHQDAVPAAILGHVAFMTDGAVAGECGPVH